MIVRAEKMLDANVISIQFASGQMEPNGDFILSRDEGIDLASAIDHRDSWEASRDRLFSWVIFRGEPAKATLLINDCFAELCEPQIVALAAFLRADKAEPLMLGGDDE